MRGAGGTEWKTKKCKQIISPTRIVIEMNNSVWDVIKSSAIQIDLIMRMNVLGSIKFYKPNVPGIWIKNKNIETDVVARFSVAQWQ